MKARVQGADELVIEAPSGRIWDILVSSQELPKWMPVVRSTTGDQETVGAVRECEIDFNGKPGRVVESCVEVIPERRIAWTMDEDSYGFGRMLADYGFAYDLEPRRDLDPGAYGQLLRAQKRHRSSDQLAYVAPQVPDRAKACTLRASAARRDLSFHQPNRREWCNRAAMSLVGRCCLFSSKARAKTGGWHV